MSAVDAREAALFAPLPATRRVIEYAVDLPVPLSAAWATLADTAAYGRWNPFVTAVDAPSGLAPGARITLRLRWGRRLRTSVAEIVTHVDPPADGAARLGWRFTGPLHALGAVRAHRIQTLVAHPGGTRYRTRETFTGWGCALLPLGYVSTHIRAQADAFAARCASPIAGGDP